MDIFQDLFDAKAATKVFVILFYCECLIQGWQFQSPTLSRKASQKKVCKVDWTNLIYYSLISKKTIFTLVRL